jgi:4-hydroxybenzoate polyprenyltransferase
MAWVSCVRVGEVGLLQATPLLGLVAGMAGGVPVKGLALHLILASAALVAYVFCLNDWAGIAADLNDPHKAAQTFLMSGMTTSAMGAITIGFGLTALFLVLLLPSQTWIWAFVLLGLGLLYSFPNGGAKGVPILSSWFHIVGGAAHFLLGYSAFRDIDTGGLLLALYCGLIFAAGHLTQEVRDYDSDRRNQILTNAVLLGQGRALLASFLLFTLAYGLMGWLIWEGMMPRALVVLLLLYPIHAFLFWRTWCASFTHGTVSRYQRQYRLVQAVVGLGIVTACLGGLGI